MIAYVFTKLFMFIVHCICSALSCRLSAQFCPQLPHGFFALRCLNISLIHILTNTLPAVCAGRVLIWRCLQNNPRYQKIWSGICACKSLGWLSVHQKLQLNTITMVHKCRTKQAPPYLCDLFHDRFKCWDATLEICHS